jgi:hypothetical protein
LGLAVNVGRNPPVALMPSASKIPPAVDAELITALQAAVIALQIEVRTLGLRVQQLEAAAPRDAADVNVRALLRRLTAEADDEKLTLRAQDLRQHGVADPAVRKVLLAADCVSTDQIGCWLRDHAGTRDGLCIKRVGRKWECTLCT